MNSIPEPNNIKRVKLHSVKCPKCKANLSRGRAKLSKKRGVRRRRKAQGMEHGAWSIKKIVDLSFGLPPFGRVPSFGFRIKKLKKERREDCGFRIANRLNWPSEPSRARVQFSFCFCSSCLARQFPSDDKQRETAP